MKLDSPSARVVVVILVLLLLVVVAIVVGILFVSDATRVKVGSVLGSVTVEVSVKVEEGKDSGSEYVARVHEDALEYVAVMLMLLSSSSSKRKSSTISFTFGAKE